MDETQTTPPTPEAIQIAVELFKHQDGLYWHNYTHLGLVQVAQFAGAYVLITDGLNAHAIAFIVFLGLVSAFIYVIGERHRDDAKVNREKIELYLKRYGLAFLAKRKEVAGLVRTRRWTRLFYGVVAVANLVLLGSAIQGL